MSRRYHHDDPRFSGWSDKALLTALRGAADELGSDFSRREYDQSGRLPGSTPMIERFGSFKAAKKEAGIGSE